MSEGDTGQLSSGDHFEYEPTPDDDPYWNWPESEIPTETHEVVEIDDGGQVTTERIDDGTRQEHSWPPLNIETHPRFRYVNTDTDQEGSA